MKTKEYSEILKKERLPAAIVDLDVFDRNLTKLKNVIQSSKNFQATLRVATKSLRVPGLIHRVLKFNPVFKGVMCFSAEEVDFLSCQKIDDFLLAYPTVQKSDVDYLKKALERTASVRVVVDSIEQIRLLKSYFPSHLRPLKILIDLDLSLRLFGGRIHFGVRRSPIRTHEQAWALYQEIQSTPGLQFEGFMGYEAQVAGLGDRSPFQAYLNPIKSWIRKISVENDIRKRQEVWDYFNFHGVSINLFNGGGTGSLNYTLEENVLTEVTAGSALYCSHLFDYYSNIQFEPSCFFACQTVRSSDPLFVTVQGGGYIASGEPGWDRVPIPVYPSGAKLISTEGCGEVQTPLSFRSKENKPKLGDPVLFRHAKAGELMERFNEVILVSSGKIVGRERTYRGLGLCFY